jgi:hypothetical protein
MNTAKKHLLLLLGGLCLLSGALHAQTLNWGSAVFSDLVDSNGNTLDNTFVFEIGAFRDDFVPDDSNTGDWISHWQAFDTAAYNESSGYFTSTATMDNSGFREGSTPSPGTISFEGLNAYMWIRNSDTVGETAEWMLARAGDWVFPAPDTDCCGNGLPIEWSTSDLTPTIVPVWGTQGGVAGGGLITTTGVYTLQTATFIPEPSPSMFSLLFAVVILLRRRR